MQETKLADEDAPLMPFQLRGYELVHHGEGRWNGVAIATRLPIAQRRRSPTSATDRSATAAPGADVTLAEEDFNPFDEARMVSAVIGGIRFSLYAPNGRVVDSPFYVGKLRWYERLLRWVRDALPVGEPLVVGGDMNVAPTDIDVWDGGPAHGGTHVSPPEREAFAAARSSGLVDGYRRVRSEPAGGSRGGTTAPATSTRTGHAHRSPAAHPVASPSASSGPRSTARRARACPSRRTTRRC